MWAWPALLLGQDLPVAGDGRDLWIAAPGEKETHQVLHRRTLDRPENLIYPVGLPLKGRASSAGIAASPQRLWLAYAGPEGLLLQALTVDDRNRSAFRYAAPQMQPSLLGRMGLVGLSAGLSGPWILGRAPDRDALQQVDRLPLRPLLGIATTNRTETTQPASTASLNGDVATPLSPTTSTAATTTAEAEPDRSEDRLLFLDGSQWVRVPLPADWPHGARAWIVHRAAEDPAPILAALESGEDETPTNGLLRVYHFRGDAWAEVSYTLPVSREIKVLAVDHQLLVGAANDAANKGVTLSALLPDGRVVPVGQFLGVSASGGETWGLAPIGQQVALIRRDGVGDLSWVRMDLQGQVTPSQPLQRWRQSLADNSGYFVHLVMLVVAFLVLLSVWRRNSAANQMTLPAGYVPAELPRRGLAALIDLAPCVLVVLAIFGLSPGELPGRMPAPNVPWQDTVPVLAMVGVFVLHTGLSEAFTNRTLGKYMMGLYVASQSGQPVHVWQILGRNALKIVELFAWPLLLLPILRPTRQRLGDLVARTVVVMPQEPEDEE